MEEDKNVLSENTNAVVDRELLLEAQSLLKDKFDLLLGCFIDDVSAYILEIQDAVANKNVEGIVRPAHTIKSTSMRMGAVRLSNLAKEIENAAREASNSNEDISQNLKIIEDIKAMPALFEQTRQSLAANAKR